MSENDFLVVCYENKNENKYLIYLWKGLSVSIDKEEIDDYLEDVKRTFFSNEDRKKVEEQYETPYDESDEFINLI
jgi:hypothetical protein